MIMRKQKRYNSEEEILAAIDECHTRSKGLLACAEALDLKADRHLQICNKMMAGKITHEIKAEINVRKEQARQDSAKARKIRKQATRLIDVKAKKLGITLAAFRTDTMLPILGRDRSVISA